MTTPAHAHTAMTRPPDAQQPNPPDQAAAAEPGPPAAAADPQTSGTAVPIRGAGTAGWTTVRDSLIPALLSAALVAVIIFAFTSLDNRITGLDNRLIAFENRVNARFAAQDAKIDALNAKIDEINLKLTALIAYLEKTDEVDAALAGEITASAPPAPKIGIPPPEPP